MNAIPKKSTLNIDWTTQRLLEAEQESLVIADTATEQKILVDTANVLADAVIAVADKSAKRRSIWEYFMSYTQKECDNWSKHRYGDYV